jgi:GGDEF domain-containing protein
MVRRQLWGLRLLLLSDDLESGSLRSLLRDDLLANWEVSEADSLEHARFLQQWNPCDLVLVDRSQGGDGDQEDLGSLALGQRTSLVVLSDQEPPGQVGVMENWLPRRQVLEHPQILAVVMQQAAQLSAQSQLLRQREDSLQGCQRQVNRLSDLLWQTVPESALPPWFTQRQMIERLREELTRSKRYGDPVSVVLGELADSPEQLVDTLEPCEVADWMARQLGRHKRFCYLAGQYGPRGFLLLLPRTGEAEAQHCCRRLRAILEKPDGLPDKAAGPLKIYFGIAGYSSALATVTKLLARAEERLEAARQQAAA